MRIEKLFLIVLFTISICFVNVSASTDNIGIFFDEIATVNSMPDSLYTHLDAYLILTNPSVEVGISGWEGKLITDDGVFVNVESLYGSAVNVGVYPEIIVGLSEPLPREDIVILAKLSLYAIAPGGIYFHPIQTPSLPGAERPLYVDSENLSHFILMEYYDNPLATIGVSQLFNMPFGIDEGTELETYSIPGYQEIPITEIGSEEIISTSYIYPDTLSLVNFEAILYNSGICFSGVLEEIVYKCLDSENNPIEGYGVGRFSISEQFWGYPHTSIIVLLPCFYLPGCVRLIDQDAVPCSFTVGTSYLVCGRFKRNVCFAYNHGIYLNLDDGFNEDFPKFAIGFSGLRQKIFDYSIKRNLESQMNQSSIVGWFTVNGVTKVDNAYIDLSVSDVNIIKGDYSQTTLRLVDFHRYYDGWLSYKFMPMFLPDERYLLFIAYNQNNEHELVMGHLSVYVWENGILFTSRDYMYSDYEFGN